MTEKKTTKALGDRILDLRRIMATKDWTDDGVFRIPSRPDGGYTYLTAEKVKKNFGQSLIEAEVNMATEFSELTKHEPIGAMSQHWTVKCTMRLYGDGEYIDYIAYGEAGDSGDKGVNKAQTDAIKQIIFNEFLVADNSDPDANTSDIEVPAVGRKFTPKTPEQKEELKAKFAESQVKAQPKPEPKKAEETPQKAPEPKKEEPKAEVPEPQPVSEEKAPEVAPANKIQVKAIEKILAEKTEDRENGLVTDGELSVIMLESEKALKSSKLASEFIIKYRRV